MRTTGRCSRRKTSTCATSSSRPTCTTTCPGPCSSPAGTCCSKSRWRSARALPRADRTGAGARPRAGGRARAAAVVAVGQGQGADRRRRDRRAAVRADRAVAAAVPARLRRLAVRHPTASGTGSSRSRSTSSISPGGIFSGAGEPVSVYARANGKRADHPELHDNFSAIVTFPGGRYAVISQTLAAWEHHQTAKLTGTDGAIWASWSGAMDRTFEPTFCLKLQTGDALADVPIAKPSGEVYELVDEVAAVVRAVRDGTPVPCTGEDGLWSVAMCLKAAESLESGQPVPIVGRRERWPSADAADRTWYAGVTRYQWLVLVIASAGWMFDAFEGQVFNITRGQMLADLHGIGRQHRAGQDVGGHVPRDFPARRHARRAGVRIAGRSLRPQADAGAHHPVLLRLFRAHVLRDRAVARRGAAVPGGARASAASGPWGRRSWPRSSRRARGHARRGSSMPRACSARGSRQRRAWPSAASGATPTSSACCRRCWCCGSAAASTSRSAGQRAGEQRKRLGSFSELFGVRAVGAGRRSSGCCSRPSGWARSGA